MSYSRRHASDLHSMFHFRHEVADIIKSVLLERISFISRVFGKQDLREVAFKIFLLNSSCGGGTDLGTGDSQGRKVKSVRALSSGLDDCCGCRLPQRTVFISTDPLRNKSAFTKYPKLSFSLN